MPGFHYVYVLDSIPHPTRRHIGVAEEFSARLTQHNLGAVPATARDRPWKLRAVVAFRDAARAEEFGKYLKTSAGRAFARRWL
ncbi:MAG: GIY-YIG nuclease family protein [Opitutaceae bacterium]